MLSLNTAIEKLSILPNWLQLSFEISIFILLVVFTMNKLASKEFRKTIRYFSKNIQKLGHWLNAQTQDPNTLRRKKKGSWAVILVMCAMSALTFVTFLVMTPILAVILIETPFYIILAFLAYCCALAYMSAVFRAEATKEYYRIKKDKE